MPNTAEPTIPDLLRLTLVRGLGPSRVSALLGAFKSIDAVCVASPAALARVPGIGPRTADRLAADLRGAAARAAEERQQVDSGGAHLRSAWCDGYPPLLGALDRRPPLLYVRGTLEPAGVDRFTVAIVGSRRCTAYGLEQAARFGEAFAAAGLTVVSGGARGIDAAAHRGALRAHGRTVAVLGCGLARCYPPEHAALFDEIAADGAVVSELPMRTAPSAENFPARNRLISGMSLGVVVIEAGLRSGALITARLATEDHGREVMAVPGRVDSPASAGTLELLKQGGAHLVTSPADAIEMLENAARHLHLGTHADRFAPPPMPDQAESQAAAGAEPSPGDPVEAAVLVAARAEARTADELVELTGFGAGPVRAACTMLEVRGQITRNGDRYAASS